MSQRSTQQFKSNDKPSPVNRVGVVIGVEAGVGGGGERGGACLLVSEVVFPLLLFFVSRQLKGRLVRVLNPTFLFPLASVVKSWLRQCLNRLSSQR